MSWIFDLWIEAPPRRAVPLKRVEPLFVSFKDTPARPAPLTIEDMGVPVRRRPVGIVQERCTEEARR